MNINLPNLNNHGEKFAPRPYQHQAWKDMGVFVKQRIRGTLEQSKEIDLRTSLAVWMATGSGKTFTVGHFINKMYEWRNRWASLHKMTEKPQINTLVLNNRINLVDQLQIDFCKGKDGKPPLLASQIRDNMKVKVFHSKADDLQRDEEQEDRAGDKEDINNIQVETSGQGTDALYFATLQTADLKGLGEDVPLFDIIIVDEGHRLRGPTYYKSLLKYYKPLPDGRMPLVFVMSATMEPVLHLVNDPIVHFGLAEWLADPHSPQVSYNLITSNNYKAEDIEHLYTWIQDISQMQDFKEKKKALTEFKEYLEQVLQGYVSNEELVQDMLERLPSLDHTIVFASSIAEANEIADLLNLYTGDPDTAIAFHSKIDELDQDVLDMYKTGQKKVIVAVDKLNEGIDMPQTKNVIFRRNTDSAIIFQQQFGRGLRGDRVHFYDYVGALRNLAWIEDLNKAIDEIVGSRSTGSEPSQQVDSGGSEGQGKRISVQIDERIIFEASEASKISIDEIINIFRREEQTELTQEIVKEWFMQQSKNLNEWKDFSKEERKSIEIKGYRLRAISSIFGIKGDPKLDKNLWFDLLERVFNTKIDRIKKKEREKIDKVFIEKRFIDQKRTLEERKMMTCEERTKIDIHGNKLYAIASVLGIDGNPQTDNRTRYSLLEIIFKVSLEKKPKIQKLDIDKDAIKQRFIKQNKPLEQWKSMGVRDRRAIEIEGNKLANLARILGVKDDPRHINPWYEMLEVIFDVQISKLPEKKKIEWNMEAINKWFKNQEKSLEDWIAMPQAERRDIKDLWSIACSLGLQGEKHKNIYSNKNIRFNFLEKIFDTKIPRDK